MPIWTVIESHTAITSNADEALLTATNVRRSTQSDRREIIDSRLRLKGRDFAEHRALIRSQLDAPGQHMQSS
jgi:hypothetical protein